MTKVAICTLGCKVNQYESEQIVRSFVNWGCQLVSFPESADIYVINTCTVTSLSDQKSRQIIRRAIRANPGALVAVTGCYAEREADKISEIPGVGLVVGNREKLDLVRLVLGGKGEKKRLTPASSPRPRLRTRALIKVQDGCDQFCSFCQVPYVRGDLSSRPLPEIVSEASALAEDGVQEIVLTGIHLGKYGVDRPNESKLAELLRAMIELPGLRRIRLSSLEVKEIGENLISLAASTSKICRHLHIPLQSGSNDILRNMNRNYTSEEYLAVIRNIRRRIADIAITTDVMVGFPGEREEDFERSLRLTREVGFAKIHVFNFSARPGTPAASMKDPVPVETRRRRSKAILELNGALMEEHRQKSLRKQLEVLVEGKKGEYLVGLTDNYLRVGFAGPPELIGRIVAVKLTEIRENWILGEAAKLPSKEV